mmetsp:Transcript_1036/g.1144  ORF Transcript_1036/g.1144 Transcript_1036/m.1144 type:complete len:753 (-) Transcript_1036:28-2286(-)
MTSADVYDNGDSPYVFKPSNTPVSQLIRDHLPLPEKLFKDSIALPGTEKEGYSAVFRNKAFPAHLKEALTPDLDTYFKLFKNSVHSFGDRQCLAYREYDYVNKKSTDGYSYLSYREVDDMKQKYGSGLLYLLQNNPYKNSEKFLSHQKIDNHVRDYRNYDISDISFVATIYSANRMEWVLSDLMCTAYSITNTALYDTLGADTSEYILHTTQSPVVITSRDHVMDIIKLKEKYPEKLEHVISIVCLDPLDLKNETVLSSGDRALVTAAKTHRISLVDINQVIKVGEIFPTPELPPNPETLYTISFTSGTTGANPKGVLLSQKICTAGVTFVLTQFPRITNARSFSFLPLAHIFERQVCAFSLSCGSCVGFPQLGGTPLTLIEDLKFFKPNYMCNVPRVFTKYEAAIKYSTVDNPNSAFKRNVFDKVIGSKIEAQEQYDGADGSHAVYDRLFLKAIRKAFGFDNMQFVVTGSAPISPSTVKFLKASLCIGMPQGYGSTESFAGFAIGIPYEANPGSCGSVGVTTEMKLRELPAMGYKLDDPEGPRGELLLRGPQIFKQYFHNEEETKKSFDDEGWFHTGDVARISKEKGRLFIIDRVKNFFKLSQGEYVTPEKVENKYLSSSSILNQLYVHGDSLRHFLVGVVGIDPEGAVSFLADTCKVSRSALSSQKQILTEINKKENRQLLVSYLNSRIGNQLSGFEKLHNVYVEFEPLRLDREVVTATQKLKRPIAFKFFKPQIDAMYEEGSLVKGPKL